MDPVIITFTDDELTRMYNQVGEHNTVENDGNVIHLCICRECDTVRAFKATTPIKVEINNRAPTIDGCTCDYCKGVAADAFPGGRD